ncbi:MAG: hypothetical protein GY774_20930 [Planctomycetes bacterium]|nr:hypothetical protein [Planctomycetota bacterium]
MKTIAVLGISVMTLFLLFSTVMAEDAQFDPDKMIDRFREVAKPTEEELKKLKPKLENQGKELNALLEKYQDKWLETIPMVEKDLEKIGKDFQELSKSLVNEEMLEKLKHFHEEISTDFSETLKEAFFSTIIKRLDLTDEQVSQLRPVISDHLKQTTEIFEAYWEDDKKTILDLEKDLKSQRTQLYDRLNKILTPKQMEAWTKYSSEVLVSFFNLLNNQELNRIIRRFKKIAAEHEEFEKILKSEVEIKGKLLEKYSGEMEDLVNRFTKELGKQMEETNSKLKDILTEEEKKDFEAYQQYEMLRLLDSFKRFSR